MNTYTFQIYTSIAQLPSQWNGLAIDNIFLSTTYLEVLEKSGPSNMTSHFIAVFEGHTLVGIALSQFIDLNNLESFGERDRCIKTAIRNFIFKNFASHVLFIGNNMLTGQNALAFSKEANATQGLKTLYLAANEIKTRYKNQGKKVHLTTFKDFFKDDLKSFSIPEFQQQYEFSTQPNMIYTNHSDWKSEQDYVDALSKKYRDQYKRARKKASGIEKRKMHLEEIIHYEATIYDLYFHVAKNAPFNSFFLAKNHFSVFKELLKDQFLFYGYFLEGNLIGFNTLIKNGTSLDTYFLGYDERLQREKMLYLNMLYDMLAYAINKGFKTVVFARTALEIKSSVGAQPIKMFGYVEHSLPILNRYMERIFKYLEPEMHWQQRHPFK